MLTSDMPIANAAVRMLTGADSKLVNIGILGDIEKDYRRFMQSDGMTLEDFARAMETMGEITTGLPIKKVSGYGRTIRGAFENTTITKL